MDLGPGEKASLRRRESDSAATSRAKNAEFWDSTDSVYNSSISTILDVSVRKPRAHTSPGCANVHAVQVARLRRNHARSLRMRMLDQNFEQVRLFLGLFTG